VFFFESSVVRIQSQESRITAARQRRRSKSLHIAGSIALCAALLIAAVYLTGLSAVLKTQNPGFGGWLLVLGMSLIPFTLGQGLRIVQALRKPR
jgi:hypothetical protein